MTLLEMDKIKTELIQKLIFMLVTVQSNKSIGKRTRKLIIDYMKQYNDRKTK